MLEVIMLIVAIIVAVMIVVIFVISNVSVFAPLAERLRVQICVMMKETDNAKPYRKGTKEKPMSNIVCAYVSGAISGLHPSTITMNFASGVQYACDVLMCTQANVINPSLLEAQHDVSTWTQAQFMTHWKLVIYTQVTDMVMLPGWEHSKGACMEHDWAVELGLAIHYMPVSPMHMPLDEPMYEHTDDFPPLWSMLYNEDDFNPQKEDEWDPWYIEDAPHMRMAHQGCLHNWKTDKAKATRGLPTIGLVFEEKRTPRNRPFMPHSGLPLVPSGDKPINAPIIQVCEEDGCNQDAQVCISLSLNHRTEVVSSRCSDCERAAEFEERDRLAKAKCPTIRGLHQRVLEAQLLRRIGTYSPDAPTCTTRRSC